MPKLKDAHLIQLDLQGQTAKFSQPEYDLSPDEWHRRRTDAFAQVRRFGGVPQELIQLVEDFQERRMVELFVRREGDEVALRIGVKVRPDKANKSKRLSEMIAHGRRINEESARKGMSASEAMAFILRLDLRALKHSEREKIAAPVRTLKCMPRSLIAEIAMDLLGSCETWGYPPGHFLNSLVRELLNLDQDKQGMSRDIERQELAASIIAQASAVGTRELARALDVNASTVSRWRKNPEFNKLIERKRAFIATRARSSKKLKEFAQKEPLQKETIELLLSTAKQLFGSKARSRKSD